MKTKDKQIEELKRRLELITDDAIMLSNHLTLAKCPEIEDSNGCTRHNYIGNILTCADLGSDEYTNYLTWNHDTPNAVLTIQKK